MSLVAGRWGPWTQGKLNKLRYDTQNYFRAYYAELRKHISAHDPDFQVLPLWFKGNRRIQVQACTDGVMVVHRPFDEDVRTFPDHEDSYEFFVTPDLPVGEAVARMVPARLGGDVELILSDYEPGEPFGSFHYREPIQLIHRMDEVHELVEEIPWTRLDAVDMGCLDLLREKSEARRDARQVLDRCLPIN
jgi:hypothetical protein